MLLPLLFVIVAALLPDGRVLTVYYYNLFGKYFIGGTYWKP